MAPAFQPVSVGTVPARRDEGAGSYFPVRHRAGDILLFVVATKSYKLRLDMRPGATLIDRARFTSRHDEVRALQQWLDNTREAFNRGVDYLTGWLLRMHRGAGVYRQKKEDGIWREWQEVSALHSLNEARQRFKTNPTSFALLENRELLDAFRSKGKSEVEAVELAECCRRIAKELCPPSEDSSGAQMPRDDLDLLTLKSSIAKGIRDRGVDKYGKPKQKSGRRPRWMLKQAIASTVSSATDWGAFETKVVATPQFLSAEGDGKSLLTQLRKRHDGADWPDVRARLSEYASTWQEEEKKAKERVEESAKSGSIAAYARLLKWECLPLPGLQRPSVLLRLDSGSAEWNYAMWNMAGQRVRSHLGWVRRRANERMLWELRTTLFERGGWIRTKLSGKAIRQDDITPDHIRSEAPPEEEAADFERRHGYSTREWVKALRQYETAEMPKHLEGVSFGAAEQPRIRKRTAKGWVKVRDRWVELVKRAQQAGKPFPSADDLLGAFDQMRSRRAQNFGDRRLFEWLAAPKRRWLWDGASKGASNDCGRDDRDCVAAFIAHNEHLANKPDSVTFTRSDPVKHPVWPFFGENSAVEYWLSREPRPNGEACLALVLKQLLAHQPDGSYSAVDRVKVALRGYGDFEKSFAVPDDAGSVSAKQALVFRDDLLGGQNRQGTLSGMKLTWARDELEAFNRKIQPTKRPPRIYANFSCDAGETPLPDWLTKHVGSYVKPKKPRDGMTQAFFLKKTISKDGATSDGGTPQPPGKRKWPKEAISSGFAVRGTDLGYRTSSAGAWWRLSFTRPDGKVSWQVGMCEGKPVYAALERTSTVSLPGDGEAPPPAEQDLRDTLYSLRARLNLNNALLRIARLLLLEAVTQRKPDGHRMRRRSDGTMKRIGTRWKTETRRLDDAEIVENCRKGAEHLSRWAVTDAMNDSLEAIGPHRSLWDWLASQDGCLKRLVGLVPTTVVSTEKQAKEQGKDRDALKSKRTREDEAFADAVYELRAALARALCDGHEAEKHRRATAGLWSEFDAALLRELSYGDAGSKSGKRTMFQKGLIRLVRKPPVTKHKDRKDDANNLPHGRTHRGGVSMARLNFLDDVKNLVRRWSCRPRWPGDVRRVPEDAKFDRSDTEHLDNLREHRAKLIAHADVAQTLGFEQDLRRGLWRYREKSGAMLWHRPERGHWYRENDRLLVQCQPSGAVSDADARHPHRAYDPAHVLVYEDLTRYRMSSDRPRNENAGLARWSHRRILAFAQHIGGLFGVPVAIVDARFSSRYCSECGAPGCRVERFDPVWLDRPWLKRLLATTPTSTYDREMARVASRPRLEIEQERPWVLRDGGPSFVCSNSNCKVHEVPISADENAAANIGLRFLRGLDAIRLFKTATGLPTKPIGYMRADRVLRRMTSSDTECWELKAPDANERSVEDSRPLTLFRDPSGGCLHPDLWYEGKVFWASVATSCAKALGAANASRWSEDESDDED